MEHENTTRPEVAKYQTPMIKDHGDLRDLTNASKTGTKTDVPLGTPVPPFDIFTA
jgi:hypothetical protein